MNFHQIKDLQPLKIEQFRDTACFYRFGLIFVYFFTDFSDSQFAVVLIKINTQNIKIKINIKNLLL